MRFTLPFPIFSATLILAGVCSAQDANFMPGSQFPNYGSRHCLYRTSPPSISLSVPRSDSPNAPTTQGSGVPDPGAFGNQSQIDQVYDACGLPLPPPAKENTRIELPSPTPSATFNAGVGEITTPNSLRELGYGVSLAQYASAWRAHKPHAVRVYTNADIANLPSRSRQRVATSNHSW